MMQISSLCASGTNKKFGRRCPHVRVAVKERALNAEARYWIQLLPSRELVLGSSKSHQCVLHHQVARRGATFLLLSAETRDRNFWRSPIHGA
eukprot:1160165-Pelagomonas_calceolata.AAC.5